ncbi:putative phosphotyrosyl phosphatase activator [Cavenderia fasciculata]|uniref:Serine/threonine-protein phosphatase 2A activator n=1 Tax=Cavenderia fasciculata TaxID=261658 RepID=F4PH06_CACFS|nr:putative phosphotyrosyl phosphatase activator [Cavenderia fasciculata]EGG24990.1 putative phosphotyrosyl phosphatase activator [Cavenderia fasciculata]|eukprot:XP_004362841.1 putative phosphotyrosyl phosphatase activator [Cavenderia fasciculata]
MNLNNNNNNNSSDSSDSNNSGKPGYNHLECLSKLISVDLKTPIEKIAVVQEGQQQWVQPKKVIHLRRDLKVFQQSETYNTVLKFIVQLTLKVEGLDNNSEVYLSNNVERTLELIDKLDSFIKDIPPKAKRTRFGNESFVEWFDKVELETPKLVKDILKDKVDNGLIESVGKDGSTHVYDELAIYLINSFGDRTRIDYGSGHELNFICFLLGLTKIGYFDEKDYAALVLRVFVRYMKLMRLLESVYWLEPAGSHGVWGLDDYHFLSFLFGSSQLIEHKYIRPKSIRNQETVLSFASSFMYLACIHFIISAKTGSLVEHSPMLVDISGVKTWAKVNEGMVKMYKNELLGKLPVMQHFFFGSILPFIDDANFVDEAPPEPKQIHTHTFSSCGCISRVPSMFAVGDDSLKDLNIIDNIDNNNNNNSSSVQQPISNINNNDDHGHNNNNDHTHDHEHTESCSH